MVKLCNFQIHKDIEMLCICVNYFNAFGTKSALLKSNHFIFRLQVVFGQVKNMNQAV